MSPSAVPENFASAWAEVATAAGLAAETTDRLGALLEQRHREPHRHYHGVEHVEAVLAHLDTLEARTVTTTLAAFFHDAIYDPVAPDNEERSADLADAWLAGLDLAPTVSTIVRATAGHALPDDPPEHCAAFLDADLAILGASTEGYDRYRSAIRAEYRHLDDATFRAGRARVLGHFLERPVLYFTERGRALWESPARTNLAAELAELAGPAGD